MFGRRSIIGMQVIFFAPIHFALEGERKIAENVELYKVTWYTVTIVANDKESPDRKSWKWRCPNEKNQYLVDFYNNYDEDSRLAPKHGRVEFLTTMRYIEKHLKSGDHVLEIGAGTGRYSHALARQGYTVDAVELIEHNIEVFRKNTSADENISVVQGNALDLSAFSDDKYDITLLLGPLYHLYTERDKQQGIREAIRVTKKGGIIFAAYVISDGCLLDDGFKRNNFSVAEYVKSGLLDSETFAAKSEPKDLFSRRQSEDVQINLHI